MKILKKNIHKLNYKNTNECVKCIFEAPVFSGLQNYNGRSHKAVYSHLNNLKTLSLGYFQDNELKGFIFTNFFIIQSHCEIEILLSFVKKDFRRLGIGNILIDTLIKQKKYCNIIDIYLEFSNTNKVAKIFYENYGFKKISNRKKYYILKNNKTEDASLFNFKKIKNEKNIY